jgi:hypothetical protein
MKMSLAGIVGAKLFILVLILFHALPLAELKVLRL